MANDWTALADSICLTDVFVSTKRRDAKIAEKSAEFFAHPNEAGQLLSAMFSASTAPPRFDSVNLVTPNP
jgi:hypothetical protein